MARAKKGTIKDATIKNGNANTIANYHTVNHYTPPPPAPWANDKQYVLENIVHSQENEIKGLEQHISYLNSMLEKSRQEVRMLRGTVTKCRCNS